MFVFSFAAAMPVDAAMPLYSVTTWLQERKRNVAKPIFDQIMRDRVLSVRLKPVWRGARVGASFISYLSREFRYERQNA